MDYSGGGGVPASLGEMGSSSGGGGSETIFNSNSNHGSHSNNGNGSDTTPNHDNGGISSPESTGPPYVTIIPSLPMDRYGSDIHILCRA